MPRAVMLWVGLCLATAGATASACGEHGRRLAAEFHLLGGDAALLQRPGVPAHQQRGLRARIENILGYLPLIARYYGQECGSAAGPLLGAVDELRALAAAAHWPAFVARVEALQRQYPLDTRGFIPVGADPLRMQSGAEIYRTLCQGCHRHPDASRDNPARDLFAQARGLDPVEFAARLMLGIRGVRLTSLENSLSDEDLASLQAYLTHGSPPP